jgi:hypothetical protein
MVYDLAKRAERQGVPYENLEAMYHFAEVSLSATSRRRKPFEKPF